MFYLVNSSLQLHYHITLSPHSQQKIQCEIFPKKVLALISSLILIFLHYAQPAFHLTKMAAKAIL